jgi:hypothetical protein
VIVRDMWLTGFDAPCCYTMYVDKPMAGHNLMQAIARGRLRSNCAGPSCRSGAELQNALASYTQAKGKCELMLKAVGLDRRARPLFRPNGRCAWNADEKMKSSLRRWKVKWARRGGHALPGLGSE